MNQRIFRQVSQAVAVSVLLLGSSAAADAATVYWTDWLGSNAGSTNQPFTATGQITTTTSSVTVTYNNPQGVGFYQADGASTDYWTPRNASSPYISPQVDNPPPDSDIVALQWAGNQSLTFSEAIANPVFAFVSLNGNGYEFLNQDFNILSVGCGYWGCGNVTKQIEDIGGGNILYKLIGSGEPHGVIQFTGAFSSLTWNSLTNEYWNGFTVGVQGTAAEVFPTGVPEPLTLSLFGAGLAGAVAMKRRKSKA